VNVYRMWPSVIIGLLLSSVVLAGCGLTGAPTGVTATPGNGQVTISWTVVTTVTSYNIYWSTSSGVTTSNGTKITGVTSPYTQTGLTNGTTYYYVVTAVTGTTESVASNEVSASPSATALSAPTQITATPGSNQVTLAWLPVGGASSYNIYYSTTTGVTTVNGTKIADVTMPYVQTGLTNGTTYYYVVTAVNTTGESAASPQVSAIPALNPALAGPTGVTATPGNGQATILWTAVTGATSYNIYYSTNPNVSTANGTRITGVTTPSYTQTGLGNGTTYYFVVTAVNSSNGTESTPSNPVSVTPST
jgi:fibronectin type 3 domain-containing protein